MNRDSWVFLKAGIVTLMISFPAMVAVKAVFTRSLWTTLDQAAKFRPQILMGFVAMFMVLLLTVVIGRYPRSALFVGGYFAAIFIIGVVAAATTSLFMYPTRSYETPGNRFHSYVVKPVAVFSIYGSAPAFVIGLIGHRLFRAFGGSPGSRAGLPSKPQA